MSAEGAEAEAGEDPGGTAVRRVRFAGRAGPFLRVQVGRALLTLLTLGFHRFWWRTANRRRLWEETTVDGDALEYLGRGSELLVGTLLAFVVVFVPLGILSQAMTLWLEAGGSPLAGLAGQAGVVAAFGLLWSFAVWRSRRYLLSRSSWRGIRAGMAGNGWSYAWLSFRMVLLQLATLGLATPYAAVRRWNALWSDAVFGTERFVAAAAWSPLVRPFLLSLLVAVIGLGAVLLAGGLLVAEATAFAEGLDPEADRAWGMREPAAFIPALLVLVVAGLVVPLAFAPWQAAFHRQAVGATRLGGVTFGFAATTGDWVRYLGGNLLLVLLTLGVGALLLPWRQWAFWSANIRLHGDLDPATVRQSQLSAPAHGEGLAEGFDLGGI